MNLLIKSSILALLATASGVYADICIDTGNNAAQLVIARHWCEPGFSSTASLNPEERCRAVAIRTCQSGDTLRDIIDRWCPETRPRNTDIFNLGNRCERQVDSLIGLRGEEFNDASFIASTAKVASSPVVDGFRAGQQAVRELWEGRRFRSNCRSSNLRIFKSRALRLKDSQFPNSGGSTTRAFNQAARQAVDSEVKRIENECASPPPTPPPTPDNSVAGGFRAGQQAMQQWWKDEGSTCSNAWSGIITPAADEIKDTQFPNKGSSNTRARNQGARLGVDSEVRSIQENCFSANDMNMDDY